MNIWVPKVKIIEADIAMKARIVGRYRMQVVREDGSVRLDTGWFDNLITNGGLDQFDSSSIFANAYVGSGNTAPAFTDTQLVALVGTSTGGVQSSSFTAQSSSPYFGTTTVTFSFPAGTATGNLSEIGVGPTATTLFSRALILDGVGSPTTITILSNEQLNVTYQLGQIVPLTDVVGSITITGIGSVSTTLRAANATAQNIWAYRTNDPPYCPGDGGPNNANTCSVFNAGIGAITGQPAGGLNGFSSATHSSYTNGTFQRTVTCTYGLSVGNVGGINSATVAFGNISVSRGQYQIGFGTTIAKDSTHVLTLNYTNSWSR